MIESGKNELTPGKYIQSEDELLRHRQLLESNKKILFALLNRLAGQG
jgi:hypothetical protein